MSKQGKLEVTTPSDREIVMTRTFDAPRELVFDAFTRPELVRRWLLGPDGWSMPVCEIDLKAGGKFRYVWRSDAEGNEMTMTGSFREVVRPERIVHNEQFEDPWYPGEAVITTNFVEQAGRTTVTMTCLYDSREIRDGVMKSGMESGVERSYERLEDILAASVTAAPRA